MPNNGRTAPPSTIFERIIKALVPRSNHAIDLHAYNIAREKIEQKRKKKRKRKHLWLAYSSNSIK